MRALVTGILEDRGYLVAAYASFREASQALNADPPDLLITDVELPDGCGLDLLGLRDAAGQKVPAIVLSSLNRERDFVRGFAAGAVDYLGKPFSRDELLARCAIHLARVAAQATHEVHIDLPEKEGLAFGRYKIERELGRGGYGQVFLARDAQRGDARVALKVLSALSGDHEEAKLRFIRETYTLASLSDPRIAVVYDVGASQGRLYYAMEYVEGTPLAARIWSGGTLDEAQTCALARGLLGALVVIARANLVHRDLKPANVILKNDRLDAPVLVDFGLAKRPYDRSVTDPNMIVGTPGFVSPEVIRGGAVDQRSDLFSLGLTLRFALVGEEVFPALKGVELLTAMARGPIPPPEARLSPPFAAFLERLVEIDPEERLPNAEVALGILDTLAGGDPARAPGGRGP